MEVKRERRHALIELLMHGVKLHIRRPGDRGTNEDLTRQEVKKQNRLSSSYRSNGDTSKHMSAEWTEGVAALLILLTRSYS